MKQTIKLKESELKRMIAESIKVSLKEGMDYITKGGRKPNSHKRNLAKTLNEGTTFDRDIQNWEKAKEMLGADTMLDAFMAYMDCDQIHQMLDWLERDYDLDFMENDEEEF